MTEHAYKELGGAQALFKDLVWDQLVNGALATLFVHAPFLNVWPVSQIIRAIALNLTNRMFDGIKLSVDLQAITLVNQSHRAAFNKSSVILAIIAKEKGVESEEFKKARSEAKRALSLFVRFAEQ